MTPELIYKWPRNGLPGKVDWSRQRGRENVMQKSRQHISCREVFVDRAHGYKQLLGNSKKLNVCEAFKVKC